MGGDFFRETATKGRGTGKWFTQFPIHPGDSVPPDRGYSTTVGIHDLTDARAVT